MTTRKTGTGPVGAAHVPVMEGQVVGGLRPRPGARLVDGTLGLGGHAAALLTAAPDSTLLGIDQDEQALALARTRLATFGDRAILRRGSFADLRTLMSAEGWDGADGVLLDLGVSSLQLDVGERGFSFRSDGPLDMRMDRDREPSAADVVNTWDESELARVIFEYGEERRSRPIARAIVRARPLTTTAQLADVVARVIGRGEPGLHPATRTFQGIRIAVNDELGALDRVLSDGWQLLRSGGRMAILAYHSLEDRRVKDAFRRWAADCICPPAIPQCACDWNAKVCLVTSRPLRPEAEEIARNPRARSARLRVVERL